MSGFLKDLLADSGLLVRLEEKSSLRLSDLSQQLQTVQILTTDQTLPLFFQLVASLPQCSHAQDRLDFWQKYLEKNLILQTWFCLTVPLIEQGRELFPPNFRFAVLEKTHRVSELHGVLLLRFQNFMVAEWSHLGKCRFWLHSNLNAPRLFRWHYTRDELLQYPNYIQQHYFSDLGRWQKNADQWIGLRTSSRTQEPHR